MSIELVIEARPRPLGNLEVARVLPERRRRQVGPFVFFDHLGPAALAPGQGLDVPPHPHIGLATVTYLFDGAILHRDNLGNVQEITPGAINLMTAGRGIVHSERSSPEVRAAGGPVHGLQLWLAQRLDDEDGDPGFVHVPASALPAEERFGVTSRVLLGEAMGRRAPVDDRTGAVLIDLELATGARVDLPAIGEVGLYVATGEVAADAGLHGAGRLLIAAPGTVVTATRPSRLVLLGGAPLDRPRFVDWNFVASSRDRIERAKAAWRAQTYAKVPGDEHEFVPLP